MKAKIIKVDQGTEKWLAVRKLKMTASNAYAISCNSTGLKSYCKKIVIDSLCESESFSSKAMQFGNEYEPEAREKYEMVKGVLVDQIGFAELSEFVGASPDGLVGDDGLVEIKCRYKPEKHFDFIMKRKIELSYYWQMQMQMYVLDRKWCDFVSYQPFFKENSLIIDRVERNNQDIEKLKLGLVSGERQIKELIENYNSLKK